jgi:hypothetical protein
MPRMHGLKKKGRSNLPSQSNTSTSPRGFVHLTEHQRDLGFAVELNDRSLLHFVVQIVTLTGSLSHTSEDRVTTVGLGDVVLTIPSANMGVIVLDQKHPQSILE